MSSTTLTGNHSGWLLSDQTYDLDFQFGPGNRVAETKSINAVGEYCLAGGEILMVFRRDPTKVASDPVATLYGRRTGTDFHGVLCMTAEGQGHAWYLPMGDQPGPLPDRFRTFDPDHSLAEGKPYPGTDTEPGQPPVPVTATFSYSSRSASVDLSPPPKKGSLGAIRYPQGAPEPMVVFNASPGPIVYGGIIQTVGPQMLRVDAIGFNAALPMIQPSQLDLTGPSS